MAVTALASTIPGGVTPVCGECGVAMCWDIANEEYHNEQAFWDAWICQDCNGGKPFMPVQKRPMPPMLLSRERE